jgi:hypothetical protein
VESTVAVANALVQPMPFSAIIIAEKTNYLPVILWSVYLIVTIGLLARFATNLIKISRKINSNPSEKVQNATLILLTEKVLPHTFLHYIFINKDDYKNRKIEVELYTHELTHVNQKHTLDILLIELMKTIFWFNPLLFLYKKAIQLNHEFLADEKVVSSYNNVPFYQNLLLEKASWNNTFYLASNLNYLVTKKRLIMMTKTTSNKMLILKVILVLPILFMLIIVSCNKTTTPDKNLKTVSLEEVVEIGVGETWIEPQFSAENKRFKEYLLSKYTKSEFDLKNKNLEVRFTVKKDGSVMNLKVLNAENSSKETELLTILKNAPRWVAGSVNGEKSQFQQNVTLF